VVQIPKSPEAQPPATPTDNHTTLRDRRSPRAACKTRSNAAASPSQPHAMAPVALGVCRSGYLAAGSHHHFERAYSSANAGPNDVAAIRISSRFRHMATGQESELPFAVSIVLPRFQLPVGESFRISKKPLLLNLRFHCRVKGNETQSERRLGSRLTPRVEHSFSRSVEPWVHDRRCDREQQSRPAFPFGVPRLRGSNSPAGLQHLESAGAELAAPVRATHASPLRTRLKAVLQTGRSQAVAKSVPAFRTGHGTPRLGRQALASIRERAGVRAGWSRRRRGSVPRRRRGCSRSRDRPSGGPRACGT